MLNIRIKKGVGPMETVLLAGFGLLLIINGVAQLTDVLSYTLPATVYIILGVVLLLWGVSPNQRS